MATAFDDEECALPDPIDRWFRELDQRLICQGAREWQVQVTSILHEQDVLWIQIADDSRWPGSVLLRVQPTTPVDQAVRALSARPRTGLVKYPRVINGFIGQTAA